VCALNSPLPFVKWRCGLGQEYFAFRRSESPVATVRGLKMMMRSRAFAILIGASVLAAPAIAGEITGGPNPKPTQGAAHARSVCAFSGQEDGLTLIGFNPDGSPIIVEVETGPGLVQTPHHENSNGIIHEPGIPGDQCRGNVNSEL